MTAACVARTHPRLVREKTVHKTKDCPSDVRLSDTVMHCIKKGKVHRTPLRA